MAIQERTVKNKRNASGELTGKAGTVYDVNIKYKSEGKSKTYSRKGFPTRREAQLHEAEMKNKLTNPSFTPPTATQRKLSVQEYMTDWLERHGASNLRPSTKISYQCQMKNHIFPYIGDVHLKSELSLTVLKQNHSVIFIHFHNHAASIFFVFYCHPFPERVSEFLKFSPGYLLLYGIICQGSS